MKFSIVIPVHDVAPWLRVCLDSVLAQTFGDWEAICVDDGSTDGSGAMLDEYAACDARFVVVHQANLGRGGARNAALEIARGEWLCYLDGDDLFSPEMLATGAKLIRENPECDIVRVGAAYFNDGSDPKRFSAFDANLLSGAFWAGFYRRSRFGGERFPDYLVGEDRVYAATCVFKTGRIAEAETVGYLYRQRATSVSHVGMTARKARDSFLHVAQMLKVATASGRTLESAFRRQLVAQVLEEGATNCRQLEPLERHEVEVRWRECVAELRQLGLLSAWGRFVSVVLCLVPLEMTVCFLCVLPYRLKKKGVHR